MCLLFSYKVHSGIVEIASPQKTLHLRVRPGYFNYQLSYYDHRLAMMSTGLCGHITFGCVHVSHMGLNIGVPKLSLPTCDCTAPRSGCKRLPSVATSRYLSSFVPHAIGHHKVVMFRLKCSCMLYYYIILFLSTHVCNFHFGCNKVLLDMTSVSHVRVCAHKVACILVLYNSQERPFQYRKQNFDNLETFGFVSALLQSCCRETSKLTRQMTSSLMRLNRLFTSI